MCAARLDPRVKQQLMKVLLDALYAPSTAKFHERLREIITTNTTGARYVHRSFRYKGQLYSDDITMIRFNQQYLLPELVPIMDQWLVDKKEIEYNETAYITGFFSRLLNASDSLEDYRRMLPECMLPALQYFVVVGETSPYTMTDQQVEQFKTDHANWILLIKKRMLLDLIT